MSASGTNRVSLDIYADRLAQNAECGLKANLDDATKTEAAL